MNIETSIKKYYGDDYYTYIDFMQIQECIIARAMDYEDFYNEDEINDRIHDAIYDELIYYHDQWIVLQYFCTPQKADWDYAIECLWNNTYEIICDILNSKYEIEAL